MIHTALLVLWVVLLGADRVSLLDKAVPFVFTPFLALTPIVVVSEWLRHRMARRPIVIPRTGAEYLLLATALLAVVFASVTMGHDPATSAPRAVLLLAQVAGTAAVVMLAWDRNDFPELMARASVIGIVLYAGFDLAQLGTMFGMAPKVLRFGPVAISLETIPYAGVIPRLSGPVGDPNRAGWVLLFMGFLVAMGERRVLVRRVALTLAAVLIAFTLSRSTLLAIVATTGVLLLSRRRIEVSVAPLVAGLVAATAMAVLLFVAPPDAGSLVEPLAPLADRFSSAEGSASEHVMLLKRGVDEATSSGGTFLLGVGYGNAYLSVQDLFPGNKYGNFHSLYITMLVESGIAALLIILVLLLRPLFTGSLYAPLVAGAVAFNIFYQTSTEPVFWCLLALAWISAGRESREPRSG